jgi:hypothetical protein
VDNKRLGGNENDDVHGVREAWRLALRNLLFLRGRTVVPLLVIALLACALDFFAGFQRVLMQREQSTAAFAQALGQLAIIPAEGRSFPDEHADRLRNLAAATAGVALTVPHVDRRDALQYVAVYVTRPDNEEAVRNALGARIRSEKLSGTVIPGTLLSDRFRAARRIADAELGVAGLALLALAGAISFWAAAVNGKRRRRELAVMRSFGMQRRGITAHVLAEGILVGIGAVILASMLSSAASWLANGLGWHLPVELDPVRLLGTLAALLAVSVAAAAVPAMRVASVKINRRR